MSCGVRFSLRLPFVPFPWGEAMKASIVLSDFRVDFPNFSMGPIELDVRAGERLALIGANGAGKSTTLNAIAGRLTEYRGRVEVGGEEVVAQAHRVRESVGLLPERLLGFGWMTVAEHIAFLSNFFPTWDKKHATELLDRLALPAKSKVGTLSKGMQIKLALIGAEAFRPPILLLDEPTSGIDPVMRGELLAVIADCAPRGGERIVVFSSHILEDVERIADRVVLLQSGSVICDMSTEALQATEPGTPISELLYSRLTPHG